VNFASAIQGLRHGPEKMAESFRIAAETARRDPFWSPEEGERRARAYEAQAREWETIARGDS
jgi:hypothetical protein